MPETTLVAGAPPGSKGPDDITRLATPGLDGGRSLIWVAFQNGINPDGTPGTAGGATASTVAGFDPTSGTLIEAIPVTGKVDGLAADHELGRLLATDNEDLNSAFNVINPAGGSVVTYAYSPDPGATGRGGTDSIAVRNGHIYVAHSNPATGDTTPPAEYEVTLDDASRTANLRPVFFDDSTATDATTGQPTTLALTDPDTNLTMPESSPRFAGDLATVSQGDGEMVFASHAAGAPRLTVLPMTDNVPGNAPPVDGVAVASADRGTLYVVDGAGSGSVHALDTSGWPAGTVFVGEASDTGNPLLGTLNLTTGVITPLANAFASPKGLLFVPDRQAGDGA